MPVNLPVSSPTRWSRWCGCVPVSMKRSLPFQCGLQRDCGWWRHQARGVPLSIPWSMHVILQGPPHSISFLVLFLRHAHCCMHASALVCFPLSPPPTRIEPSHLYWAATCCRVGWYPTADAPQYPLCTPMGTTSSAPVPLGARENAKKCAWPQPPSPPHTSSNLQCGARGAGRVVDTHPCPSACRPSRALSDSRGKKSHTHTTQTPCTLKCVAASTPCPFSRPTRASDHRYLCVCLASCDPPSIAVSETELAVLHGIFKVGGVVGRTVAFFRFVGPCPSRPQRPTFRRRQLTCLRLHHHRRCRTHTFNHSVGGEVLRGASELSALPLLSCWVLWGLLGVGSEGRCVGDTCFSPATFSKVVPQILVKVWGVLSWPWACVTVDIPPLPHSPD